MTGIRDVLSLCSSFEPNLPPKHATPEACWLIFPPKRYLQFGIFASSTKYHLLLILNIHMGEKKRQKKTLFAFSEMLTECVSRHFY